MMSDLEIAKLEEKAKFSGWDRSEASPLVLRLLSEIRLLKAAQVKADVMAFMRALDRKIEEHECVVIEIPSLRQQYPQHAETPIDDLADDIADRSGWSAAINYDNNTVMFYKNHKDMKWRGSNGTNRPGE